MKIGCSVERSTCMKYVLHTYMPPAWNSMWVSVYFRHRSDVPRGDTHQVQRYILASSQSQPPQVSRHGTRRRSTVTLGRPRFGKLAIGNWQSGTCAATRARLEYRMYDTHGYWQWVHSYYSLGQTTSTSNEIHTLLGTRRLLLDLYRRGTTISRLSTHVS